MKQTFIINSNPQPNGDYEVHRLYVCSHLPAPQDRITLGSFFSCQEAIAFARAKYPKVAANIDGCYFCCNDCHTR